MKGWKFFKRKEKVTNGKKGLLVLIDYDNIDSHLMSHGRRIDFSKLMIDLLKIGKVKHVFLFIPFGSYHGLPPNINNLGYEIIVCQKMDMIDDSEKREDKVDSRMALMAKNFLSYEDITDVVIMTHDRHSIEMAAEAVKDDKIVSYFAIKNEMARDLQEFFEEYNINVYPIPTKERKTIFNI